MKSQGQQEDDGGTEEDDGGQRKTMVGQRELWEDYLWALTMSLCYKALKALTLSLARWWHS